MNKRLFIVLALSFTFAVAALSFRYGSVAPCGSVTVLHPAEAVREPSFSLTQHPPSVAQGKAPGRLETPASLSSTDDFVREAAPITAASAEPVLTSSMSGPDAASNHAEPSSPAQATAFVPHPDATPPSGRKLPPRGVAVPLAFQDVDLFINTAQGLQYAPVDFHPATSHSDSKAAATPTTAAVTPKPGAPGTIVVDEASASALEKMREDFTNQVGGLAQDASDPQYASRWKSAQATSDDWFRVRFGTQAFLSYQLAAATKAEAERQAAKR